MNCPICGKVPEKHFEHTHDTHALCLHLGFNHNLHTNIPTECPGCLAKFKDWDELQQHFDGLTDFKEHLVPAMAHALFGKGKMRSNLTRKQVKSGGVKPIMYCQDKAIISVQLRFDDECGNGHNTFAITGTIRYKDRRRNRSDANIITSGCIHEEIAKHFPGLRKYIKWHLCNTDGPMYYIANTIYHVIGDESLVAARNAACWPDATDEELLAPDLEDRLKARLPKLIAEFRRDMEELGFNW